MSSVYHKNIAYRRFQRVNQAKRKQRIALSVFPDATGCNYWSQPGMLGKLSKGKIHCSCGLCSAKTGKQFNRSSNCKNNYDIADRRKLDRLYYEG